MTRDAMISRKKFLHGAAGLLAASALPGTALAATSGQMGTRAIPGSGEKMPMVGVGTARVFNVSLNNETRARLTEVLKIMLAAGGRILDTSPMYGAAEPLSGKLIAEMGVRGKIFIATKVWTRGRQEGIAQMRQSLARFSTKKIELMQVHNLVDWRTQLKTCREFKEKGVFKYIGLTHYTPSAFDELAAIIRAEPIDFLQIPYSIVNRQAERVLFPLVRERKVALITHRNFEVGGLFRRVRGVVVPGWAGEFDCTSWGQFFLKFVLGHPASTCVIPGTSKALHMRDNIQAGMGRLPDARQRERMARFIADL
ncbi:MAG: aldo/keto reductase [Alphaproteobacteria bacterium]